MSKAVGKSRAGPGSRIPRPGTFAGLSRIPSAASATATKATSENNNINVKNKKKRPRLTSGDQAFELPPPLRQKNTMPPPSSASTPDAEIALPQRKVSAGPEPTRRKNRPPLNPRHSIISSYHEKDMISPDLSADDFIMGFGGKGSTPTGLGDKTKKCEFPDTTFDLPNKPKLSREGTFNKDSPTCENRPICDESYKVENRSGFLPSELPIIPSKDATFSCGVTPSSEDSQKRCDVTFNCVKTNEVVLSERPLDGTFCKSKEPMLHNDVVSEKAKRPSSWADCGRRNFILGAAGGVSKSLQGSPMGPYGSSKQSSIDQDESLGILTPDQMDSLLICTPPSHQQQQLDLRALLQQQQQSQNNDGSKSPSQQLLTFQMSKISPPHVDEDDSLLICSNQDQELLTNISQPPWMISSQLPATPSSEHSSLQCWQNLGASPNFLDATVVNTQESPFNRTLVNSAQKKTNEELKLTPKTEEPNSLMKVSAYLIDESTLFPNSIMTVETNGPDMEDQHIRRQALNLLLQRTHQNQHLINRADMTPSPPEELPLDPVDVKLDVESIADEPQRQMMLMTQQIPQEQMSLAESESKSQSTSAVSKTSNSFVASVTSITSLDNGYQGDGEMSRPVSRGAESHHLHHSNGIGMLVTQQHMGATNGSAADPNCTVVIDTSVPTAVVGRQHHARPDPMTDSDFFTESDADLGSSEDTAHRLARVIDGRLLYGHTAGNNNAGVATAGAVCLVEDSSSSCMESSGVYTDLENNSRTVSPPQGIMMKSASSSDSSAISPNATLLRMPMDEPMSMSIDESTEEVVKSPVTNKKTKSTPKSSSPSLGTAPGKENKRPLAKRNNKWDSVMNKIAENKNNRPAIHLREVKSKVSTGIANTSNSATGRVRALGKVQCSSVQSLNERNMGSQQLLKAKSRRTRVRASESNLLQADSQSDVSSAAGNTVASSVSSASAARTTPTSGASSTHIRSGSTPKKTAVTAVQAANRAAKKRDVIRTSPARQNTVGAAESVSPLHPLRHTSTKQGSPLRPAARPNTLLQKRGLSPASGANSTGAAGSGGGGPPAEPKVPRKLLTPKRPLTSTKSAPLKEHNRLPVTQTVAGAQQAANNKAPAVPCSPPSPAPLPPVPSIPEICGTLPEFPERCDGGIAGKSNPAVSAREVAMLQKSARGVEALGVLVQYLVYNLDAFACPSLKRAQRATGLSLLEAKSNCARLEQQLADQILRNARDEAERAKIHHQSNERAEERIRSLENVIKGAELDRDNAFNQILQLKQAHADECQRLQAKFAAEQLELAGDISFLRHTEQEKRAELAETRSKLDEQRAQNETERTMYEENRKMLEQELRKLEQALQQAQTEKKSAEHEANKWRTEVKTIRAEYENQIELLQQELDALRSKTAENDLNHVPRTEKSVLLDEVESLRNVLELKQSELSELRKRSLELSRAADQLPQAQAKAQTLQARVEDLQVQLQRKMDDEKELYQRNKLLEQSFHQESKQKTRLSQYNEELQYKLKQNHEVVNVLAAMNGAIPEAALSPRKANDYHHLINNNSLHNNLHDGSTTPNFVRAHNGSGGGRMSFNERYGSAERSSIKLERKHSFREKQDKHRSPVMSSSIHSNVSPSHLNPRIYNRHNSSPAHDSSSDTSLECKQNHKGQQDCCFEMEDLSPPSSPQIKAVVEKSDSVSWVLEIAEPPEMVASRLVRRAGSFRNSTPPPKKNVSSPNHQNQQQSPPLLKRPRCNTGLTQRVVASEITRQNSDPTSARKMSNGTSNKLTRSASMGCATNDDSLLADWSSCGGSSTPYKTQENSRSYHQNGTKDSQILITCDTAVLTSRCDELCPTLPAHRSLIPDQRSESPVSSVSDDSENSVDDCDKKSEENRMDGSWSEDGDTDI